MSSVHDDLVKPSDYVWTRHVLDELIHVGAEAALLRDLYGVHDASDLAK